MKVVDRINEILKAKNISKKELANRLIDLDMRTNKTGESPAKSSIYAYLNGNIEIKADMIPYIAEALGIYEQEIFSHSHKESTRILHKLYDDSPIYTKYNHILELLEYLSPKSLEVLEKTLNQHKAKTQNLNSLLHSIIEKM